MGFLDKLLFWRKDDPVDEIAGCFTLPGAELDQPVLDGPMASADDDRAEPELS
ncbi:MAG: hypothetical protein AAFO29_14020 [Actinomycetota bacterium]